MKESRVVAIVLAGLLSALVLSARFSGPSINAADPGLRLYLPITLPNGMFGGHPVPVTVVPPTARPTDVPPTAPPSATATTPPPTAAASPTTAPTLEPTPEPGDCPTANFLPVAADPHNGSYPAPTLKVTCTDTQLIVESNGIPSFEFRPMTPNQLRAQNLRWQIPRVPTMATTETQVPLLGPVAIVVDGLPIYGPNEAPAQGTADPFLDGILDFCAGHTGPNGDYHYHARPDCLFKAEARALVGRVVGYAFDGITILAPYVCADGDCGSVRKLSSSWQKTSNVRAAWDAHSYVAGSGDLDRCNGKVGPDGQYHYYATDTFPYLLACYKGVPQANGGGGGGGPGPRPTRRP